MAGLPVGAMEGPAPLPAVPGAMESVGANTPEPVTFRAFADIEGPRRDIYGAAIKGLTIIGNPPERAGALSFTLDGFSTTDVGKALDQDGIAVRSGHHCAQPILRRFGLEASVRPSFAIYTSCADIDALVASVTKLAASRR